MKTPCPACGGDSFGPYGPFPVCDPDSGHSAKLWGFECDTLDCTIMYYLDADTAEEAKQKWETRA